MHPARILLFSVELTIEKSQYVSGATVKLLYEDLTTECKLKDVEMEGQQGKERLKIWKEGRFLDKKKV